jgi:hypothetical protein
VLEVAGMISNHFSVFPERADEVFGSHNGGLEAYEHDHESAKGLIPSSKKRLDRCESPRHNEHMFITRRLHAPQREE